MTENNRTEAFIRSFDLPGPEYLNEIEKEAKRDRVPIIRPASQSLLKLLLAMKKPETILEIGTATGFSAILMAEYTGNDCQITTIEKYEKRIPIAKKNFLKSGFKDRIRLLEGDAYDIIKDLAEEGKSYDLIFLDAAKAQYIVYLPVLLKLMKRGSLLISDNVLQDGEIIESRFAVTRRNRTIHSRMREYLYEISHNEELVTDILPIGDGMTVSVKL
ncbi:MAG: O-methyltransferase [Lachnospiraceae bacterium]|nr:O-methyltransferase [Lachnospiraceae bacterium]